MVHIHAKDRGEESLSEVFACNKGMAACPTGAGYLPVERIVREAITEGYQGYVAVEHFGAQNQIEYMQKSAEFLCRLEDNL